MPLEVKVPPASVKQQAKWIISYSFLQMIKFDWHHNLKQMGSQKAIETLWTLLRSSVQAVGLTAGQIR